MAETGKISLKCRYGHEFQFRAPSSPGYYSVACPTPNCGQKVSFHYPLNAAHQEEKPKEEIKFGLLEDGSYRFRCEKQDCRQSVLVPAKSVKVGHNRMPCPKCGIVHEFDIEPTENDLLKCQTADCNAILVKPVGGDDIYSCVCEECGQEYSLLIQGGKVVKVTMKTPTPIEPIKQWPMKLVLGHFLGKKEYILSKGIHYIGRLDDEKKSDFEIKDKYASSRSVRIDVNENGGSLVYRMTVERAMNPVYHNSRELTVGDIVYLTYGDTLKLGKTLVKVQKVKVVKTEP